MTNDTGLAIEDLAPNVPDEVAEEILLTTTADNDTTTTVLQLGDHAISFEGTRGSDTVKVTIELNGDLQVAGEAPVPHAREISGSILKVLHKAEDR